MNNMIDKVQATALAEAVERSGAHSTDLQDPKAVRDLTAKCEAPGAAWAPVADGIWAGKHGYSTRSRCEESGMEA